MDAFSRYGKTRPFSATVDGLAVRVSAFVNPRLRDERGAPLGQVGDFDAPAGVEAAALAPLFAAAFAWLREQGATQVIGPISGGAHRAHRFLVEGFERAPFLVEPRNPPHAPALFAAHGFVPLRRWHSYDANRADIARLHEALAPVATRAGRAFRVERGAPSDLAGTIARLHPLLDVVWRGHAGYASIDAAELAEVFAPLCAIMGARQLGFLVDKASGTDVGFAFVFPNYAEGAAPNGVVLHTVATAPGARTRGAAHLLMSDLVGGARDDGYDYGVVALVDQDFRFFDRILPPTRAYALYGRPL